MKNDDLPLLTFPFPPYSPDTAIFISFGCFPCYIWIAGFQHCLSLESPGVVEKSTKYVGITFKDSTLSSCDDVNILLWLENTLCKILIFWNPLIFV